jgi:hypothetical protein
VIEKLSRRGGYMGRKRSKSVSFDAMVKFFIQQYNIPTKSDVEKLLYRLDRLEELVRNAVASSGYQGVRRIRGRAPGRVAMTASDMVIDVIRKFKNGVGFPEIQARTGFNEKKLRNILFRLNKLGKIARQERGIYIVP